MRGLLEVLQGVWEYGSGLEEAAGALAGRWPYTEDTHRGRYREPSGDGLGPENRHI